MIGRGGDSWRRRYHFQSVGQLLQLGQTARVGVGRLRHLLAGRLDVEGGRGRARRALLRLLSMMLLHADGVLLRGEVALIVLRLHCRVVLPLLLRLGCSGRCLLRCLLRCGRLLRVVVHHLLLVQRLRHVRVRRHRGRRLAGRAWGQRRRQSAVRLSGNLRLHQRALRGHLWRV